MWVKGKEILTGLEVLKRQGAGVVMDKSETGMFLHMTELKGLWEMMHSRSSHGRKSGLEEGGNENH